MSPKSELGILKNAVCTQIYIENEKTNDMEIYVTHAKKPQSDHDQYSTWYMVKPSNKLLWQFIFPYKKPYAGEKQKATQ